jgi:hypothetical protein
MKSQEYFFYLSSQKSTNQIVKNSILRSGKFISQKILQVLNNYSKVTSEYKPYTLDSKSSERALGPGRYPTPQPPKVPSCKFSKSPRFGDLSFSSSFAASNNSYTRLPNITSPSSKPSKISSKLRKNEPKSKNIEKAINLEAKKILESEKRERLLKSFLDKVQKAEYRKNALFKDSICKMVCLMLTHFSVTNSLVSRYSKMRSRILVARRVLGKIATISKALGRFLMVAKNLRKDKAIRRIRSLIPIRMRFWLSKHKRKLRSVISNSFDNYLTIILMKMFKDSLIKACNLLQVKLRNFLNVAKARRASLDLFWIKLNKYRILAPEHIRLFYINCYVRDKLKAHYYEKYREKKIDLLLKERRHQELADEMVNLKAHRKHFLRFFVVSDVMNLIELANSAISSWVLIGMPVKGKKKTKFRRKYKKRATIKLSLTPSPSRDKRKK